jgi:RimJ/RimL family protein N-acetyltransferase
MDISFREVKKDSIDDYILISKWSNDNSIKHFITPNFTGGNLAPVTPEELYAAALNKPGMHCYLLLADNVEIGDFSIQIDPPQLYKKVEKTGWIGITIGEEKYRGKGIGKSAIQFIENKCRDLKLIRIELGVFEYNHNAVKLYKNMGYKEIGIIKNFTFHQGKWYNDIRMEKYI